MTKSTPSKHRLSCRGTSGVTDEKTREAGRKNTAAHRARKEKEKLFYQHWINHYRVLLHEPLLDFAVKKTSSKYESRPSYSPPAAVMSKMTSEELREWRRKKKLERKRLAQAKADREKREEFGILCAEFNRVSAKVSRVHGPEALVHNTDVESSGVPPNPQPAAAHVSGTSRSQGEAKAGHENKWGIFNQVVSKLFYDEAGGSAPATKTRECTPTNVAVVDNKLRPASRTSENNQAVKCTPTNVAVVDNKLRPASHTPENNQAVTNFIQSDPVVLFFVSQRQNLHAASAAMKYIVANSRQLTPAFLQAYPLHLILRDVHRSFFEDTAQPEAMESSL
jgi:hypothetical protein